MIEYEFENAQPLTKEDLNDMAKNNRILLDKMDNSPSGSTATCVLEAKDGRVWKTIDKQIVPMEHLKSTLEWLEIFGNRQFSRHAKRRVRRIK